MKSSVILCFHLNVQQSVVILSPISPHPICAVTTRPVDVLAVRLPLSVQVRLHPLLDPDDLSRTFGPPVSEQTCQVGVNSILDVVTRVC